MSKAVFLDRDGTINKDEIGYINKPEDFELYPNADEAISLLNRAGFLVFVVTNQAGIAYGYFKIEDVENIHRKMLSELKTGKIDEIFFSPYHAEGSIQPFAKYHEDRKPGLGMFRKAREKYNFKVERSFMIGDRYSDIEFGKRAGLITILVLSGNGREEFLEKRKSWKFKPDYIVKDIMVAAKLIRKLDEKYI